MMTPSLPAAATTGLPPPPRRTRVWGRALLALGLSLGLLAALLHAVDLPQFRAQAARLPAGAWALAVLGLLLGHGLRARRLQQEWWHRRPVAWAACLRLVLLHNAAVLLLPLRSGELGYLWLARRQWGAGWAEAGRSLLWWRVQDAVALLLLALVLLPPWAPAARALLLLSAAVLIAGLWAPVRRRLAGPLAPGVATGLRAGWWCSLGHWCLKLAVAAGLLQCLLGVPLGQLLPAALGGELAGVLPVQGVAGLGTYEAGVWLGAHWGRGAAPAVGAVAAAALLVHGLSLAVALGAAGVSQWPLARGRQRPLDETESPATAPAQPEPPARQSLRA